MRLLLLVALCLIGHVQAATLADYVGTWSFTFNGSDHGSGQAVVNERGEIIGQGGAALLPNMPLQVTGRLSADGNADFSASPAGQSNTGAVFSGQLNASGTGSGTWQNAQHGMSGGWTAQRTSKAQVPPSTKQTMRCNIRGFAEFNDTTARADYFVNQRTGKGDFRILASNQQNDAAHVMLDLKGYKIFSVGAHPLDSWPLWVSTADLGKRDHPKLKGTWQFSVFDPVAKHVVGSVNFSGDGLVSGSCLFDLFLFVADFGLLPLP